MYIELRNQLHFALPDLDSNINSKKNLTAKLVIYVLLIQIN